MLINAPFLLILVPTVNGKPETDSCQRIRQVGKVHILRQTVLPRLNFLGKRGFSQPEDHHALMEYVRKRVVLFNVLDHFRNGSDSLKRNAWQGIECGLMSESFLREAEHHNRSRAKVVYNHFASVRDERLCLVDVQNIESSCVKDRVDHLELALIHHITLASGNLSQSRFRDVVLGWTKTSGSYDYLVVSEFVC